MARQQCVLVLGATGYAGRYLVQRLHNAGYRIRAVVRDQQRALAPGRNLIRGRSTLH
ncbi:NmrA family NAD(P)-binding protein [Yaniella halotolerans]|uniref:NmrA family NAD(P)-binding protein n=1 Tax=Yaniella halotolerans TaxID=225453 RepID=UPI00146E22E7|nr:NmrA family NAD(P)-binding protein [Yaniella halotolerans]